MLDDYLNQILSVCAQEFDVPVDEICSDSKKQELVYCRKAFSIVVKEHLDVKLDVIAKRLNRSVSAVSTFISNQPENKYYAGCLKRIRGKVREYG